MKKAVPFGGDQKTEQVKIANNFLKQRQLISAFQENVISKFNRVGARGGGSTYLIHSFARFILTS